jgi:hypothetical protein
MINGCKKFMETEKYEHGEPFKFKMYILFYRGNSWTVAVRQIKFGAVKYHGRTYKIYLNYYYVWRNF